MIVWRGLHRKLLHFSLVNWCHVAVANQLSFINMVFSLVSFGIIP